MKIQSLFAVYLVAAVAFAATPKPTAPARDKNAGVCTADSDCVKYPGTVCVMILSGDYEGGKCTPNYGQKPVCRGGQSGLCPQYQDPTQGYLNTQCVLVDRAQQPATGQDALVPVNRPTTTPAGDDVVPTDSTKPSTPTTTAAAGKSSAAPTTTKKAVSPSTTADPGPQPPVVPGAGRRLQATPTTTAAGKTPTTTAGEKTPTTTTAKSSVAPSPADTPADSTGDEATSGPSSADSALTPIKAQPCPSDKSLSLDSPDCWFNTVYKNRTITAQYRCVDYSMCYEQAAISQEPQKDKEEYCRPKGCVTGDRQLCNNQGTCQSNDPFQPMTSQGYACRCYTGYAGRQCEKVVGNDCDVDCGVGGACINRKCDCYDAYRGKDQRCSKCTKDAACENGNKCNLDTGKCQCAEGFIGLTCGGKLDNCAGVKCSDGGQPFDAGKKCICKCAKCVGNECPVCNGDDGRDCSVQTGGCPAVLLASDASTLSITLASAFAAFFYVMA